MGAVKQLLTELIERSHDGDHRARSELIRHGYLEFAAECYWPACRYAALGWGVLPQIPFQKRPYVKFKYLKDQHRRLAV